MVGKRVQFVMGFLIMAPEMYVVSINFDTVEFSDWCPNAPYDCDVWATVNVGNENGAAYYQIHICTPISIKRLSSKRYCFMIDEFRGVDDLIDRLNDFIEQKANPATAGDPYQKLARHWKWEYSS